MPFAFIAVADIASDVRDNQTVEHHVHSEPPLYFSKPIQGAGVPIKDEDDQFMTFSASPRSPLARLDAENLETSSSPTARWPHVTHTSEIPGTSPTHNPSPLASPMPSQSSELAVSPYASEHDLGRSSPLATPGLEDDRLLTPTNSAQSHPHGETPTIDADFDRILHFESDGRTGHSEPPSSSSPPVTPAAVSEYQNDPEHEHEGAGHGASHDHAGTEHDDQGHKKKQGTVEKISHLLGKSSIKDESKHESRPKNDSHSNKGRKEDATDEMK